MRTELDFQSFEQPVVRNNTELGYEIFKNRVDDVSRRHIPKRRATINNPSWINNDVKQAIGRSQRANETKRRINNEETNAEFIAALREVKRLAKQEKSNEELNIERIFKQNPKSFYSYINKRRIVRHNIGPLETLDGIVITTDNYLANTINNYLSSEFTVEHLNNVPQLRQYEGNILDPFNFSTEEVQEKLQYLNIYKFTGPDILHPRILLALEDKLARPRTHAHI